MSSPTALPIRECFVGYADSITTIRRSAGGMCRSWACFTAIPATRAARSGSATYTDSPSGSISLNENGTVMIRPSNSGIATCVAASSGDSPSSLASHAARPLVRHNPCRIGTSRSASTPTSQASSSPPAPKVAGLVPPAASTVTTSASALRSSASRSGEAVRSDAVKIGSGRPPFASTAWQSTSTNAVFPAMWCAR